eukprot:CAMPEP_0194314220 /NCGR_PEP_ID=MMETSP0171-20130528/11045_1 /TAXON_ID=218684 /ORGANISM="Corethron pennatum, Strain L29A3" /LENGTH=286 /DNA_ID=CAMNT_0039069527 /DNA_START=333 /DNA_END=1190 /DNA_ORIENTATION=-
MKQPPLFKFWHAPPKNPRPSPSHRNSSRGTQSSSRAPPPPHRSSSSVPGSPGRERSPSSSPPVAPPPPRDTPAAPFEGDLPRDVSLRSRGGASDVPIRTQVGLGPPAQQLHEPSARAHAVTVGPAPPLQFRQAAAAVLLRERDLALHDRRRDRQQGSRIFQIARVLPCHDGEDGGRRHFLGPVSSPLLHERVAPDRDVGGQGDEARDVPHPEEEGAPARRPAAEARQVGGKLHALGPRGDRPAEVVRIGVPSLLELLVPTFFKFVLRRDGQHRHSSRERDMCLFKR